MVDWIDDSVGTNKIGQPVDVVAVRNVSRLPNAPYLAANADKYMFSSNGFRGPTQRYVPGSSALWGVSEKWFRSDDYWTFSPRFLFTNWCLDTGTGGLQEIVNGNSITVEDVSIQVGRAGTPVRLTFNGSTGITLVDDSEAWTDPNSLVAIPPSTWCCVRVARAVANSALYLSCPAQGIHPSIGDKGEVSGSASLAAKVMAGGISTSTPSANNQYFYTASAMVAKGWDGRPVGLIVGTSIEQGVGQQRMLIHNPYGAQGPKEMGMCSKAGGALRYPAAVFAVAGGFAAGISGAGAGQGLTKRKRAFDLLPNVPFTFIDSGFGTNDNNASLSTWLGAMTPMWGAFKSLWPDQRLIQSTLWSRLASSSDGYTTVANQTLQTNWAYPAGSAWGLRRHIQALAGGLLDGFVDIQDAIDNVPGGGTRGKWRVDVLDASWSTTLSASLTGGETAVTMAAQPRLGGFIAIQDGTNESVSISATGSTAAPFSATTGTVAGAHTSGATIKEAVAQDGLHPGFLIAQFVADNAYAPAKIAGVYT